MCRGNDKIRWVRTSLFSFCVLAAACSGASPSALGTPDSGQSHDEQDAARADDGPAVGPLDSSISPDDAPSMSTCNPTPPDGAACNSVSVSGPLVPLQCLQATVPTPIGGTIVDGTYVLTSSAFYGATCPMPEQDRDTWLVCGNNWQTAQELTAGTSPPALRSLNLVVTPATTTGLSLQFTCGNALATVMIGYDATPTTLTLYVGGGSAAGEGRVDTYTRH
jgi:hypothetical protein